MTEMALVAGMAEMALVTAMVSADAVALTLVVAVTVSMIVMSLT